MQWSPCVDGNAMVESWCTSGSVTESNGGRIQVVLTRVEQAIACNEKPVVVGPKQEPTKSICKT